jgi:hypothetical protein
LLLALLVPSFAGYLILLGFAVWGAIWAVQASRSGTYLWQAGYATVPGKVKYEN